MRSVIRVGTRASALALAQADEVIMAIRQLATLTRCEVVRIRTKGDDIHDFDSATIDNKSVFTKEIEQSLIEQKIDLAVHSMKDLVTEVPKGLVIAAIPKRKNPRDVLVSRGNEKFAELKPGARLGTSSARRKAQLLAARGDFDIIETHGNVDTRLRKLVAGEFDAVVLAAAGLVRLGLDKRATEYLSTDLMIPAVGQGALAIEAREEDGETRELVSQIDDTETRRAVEAERAFAGKLGADCKTPIAAYARLEGDRLAVDGMVASRDGRKLVRSRMVSDEPNATRIGEELAESLLAKGAMTILEAA
jgi:hydroxymethylbilane synthase